MSVPGRLMAAEMAEGVAAFARAASQEVAPIAMPRAIYTFARGSSDTVANVLTYTMMARLGIPMASLPPSIFSIGQGVALPGALSLIVSQSGASDDLVACARGAGRSIAITNVPGSPVEAAVERVIPVGAGPEQAVPATKTVMGSLGAGMAMLAALDPRYRVECAAAAERFADGIDPHPGAASLIGALSMAQHIYVLGRRASYGVAQEVALKLKETCALHAEAHSASEVLHGPLQLSTKPLCVLILDADDPASQPSLDLAQERFAHEKAHVLRLRPSDVGVAGLAGPAMAAALLHLLYPIIHNVAIALGLDPDRPATLQKVTRTT